MTLGKHRPAKGPGSTREEYPSPSNEVTPEMVEAFCAEYWEDLPTDLCGQDTRKEIHRCLDGGAGQ